MRRPIILLGWILLLPVGCVSRDRPPESARWTGTWQSSAIPSVHGTIAATLPISLSDSLATKVPVSIGYDESSPYRAGELIQIDFELVVEEPDAVSGAGHSDAGGVSILFKGSPEVGQTIVYEATVEPGTDRISGAYHSIAPVDVGTFEMRRR